MFHAWLQAAERHHRSHTSVGVSRDSTRGASGIALSSRPDLLVTYTSQLRVPTPAEYSLPEAGPRWINFSYFGGIGITSPRSGFCHFPV